MKYLLMLLAIFCLSGSTEVPHTTYYPNLRCPPQEMIRWMYISSDPVTGQRQLHISFAGENQGPGHLIMVAERTNQNQAKLAARQVVGNSNGKWNALPGQAGYFKFHGSPHNHWHWHEWARYGLMRLDQWEPLEIAAKQSFCLVDSKAARLKVPAPGQGTVPSTIYVENLYKDYTVYCQLSGLGTMGQRVSAGYMDLYTPWSNAPINIRSDGIYALIGMVDPDNKIREVKEDDNVGVVILLIQGTRFQVLFHFEL